MTIIVTGKTFDNRNTLKELGGKWNSESKAWTLPNNTDPAKLDALASAGVKFAGRPAAEDHKPEAPKAVEPVKPRIEPHTERIGEVAFYGDDRTYLGKFTHQVEMFAGFSSLGAMINFVDNLGDAPFSRSRNRGWETGGTYERNWFGTPSMSAAIDIARNGWRTGSDRAMEALEIIDADNPLQRHRQHAIAGGRVNVGRMLSGNPMHMSLRAKQPSHKAITLFVDTLNSASVEADDMIVRAACIGAMVDILEDRGYSCDIVAVAYSSDWQIATTLKSAGEKMDISDLVFGLGHPSYLRRLSFAVAAAANVSSSVNGSYGGPRDCFRQSDLEPGQFYINKIEHGQQVHGSDFKAKVRSIFPTIVPENFPVTLNETE